MNFPTREQFVGAYLTLPGTTREMAHEVYDILSDPAEADLLVELEEICLRVTDAQQQRPDQEGGAAMQGGDA